MGHRTNRSRRVRANYPRAAWERSDIIDAIARVADRRGLTDQQIGERAGMSRQDVFRFFKKSSANITTVERIMRAVGIMDEVIKTIASTDDAEDGLPRLAITV